MASNELDPLLQAFVDADTEAGADSELALLIERHALPIARRIARHKLRSWRPDGSVLEPDADDVVSEAMTTLIERLNALRADHDAAPVANLVNYAATVVHSVVAHLGRRRYPERARLKNRLRYVCATAAELSLWNIGGEVACGLRAWQGRDVVPDADDLLRTRLEGQDRPWSRLAPGELATALAAVFRTIPGAVAFDTLVSGIAASAQLVEPRMAPEAVDLPSADEPQDMRIDRRRVLERVWNEVQELPLPQRAALLLNLRSATGAGLLWLMPVAGVATARQVAAVLEMPFPEFARLWSRLPLDDGSIAAQLGCTRQQVINLRMAARKRLSNRLRASMARHAGVSGVRVNLAATSTSLE